MATVPSQPGSSPMGLTTFPAIRLWNEDAGSALTIPPSANTWEGFREWALSGDFPERGKITYVAGELIVDLSPENIEYHSDVKSELCRVLLNLVREQKKGSLYIDGVLISNNRAGVSNEPDILYLAKESLQSGRAKLTPANASPESHKEVVGTVDWVLEIVSPSSVKKDTVLLRKAYFEAGIGEYWIVDVRGEAIELELLVQGERDYVATDSVDAWQRSPTFEREFQLTREQEDDGFWLYTLECRKF